MTFRPEWIVVENLAFAISSATNRTLLGQTGFIHKDLWPFRCDVPTFVAIGHVDINFMVA